MNPVDVHVGSQIRRQRVAQHMPPEQLAGLIGIDTASLTACEEGTRRASANELMMICRTLDMRPADIFAGYGT